MTCRSLVKATQMIGPPVVPNPRMRVSRGCAYSAVIAKGAVKSNKCRNKSCESNTAKNA